MKGRTKWPADRRNAFKGRCKLTGIGLFQRQETGLYVEQDL
jgi:hypothetical protein